MMFFSVVMGLFVHTDGIGLSLPFSIVLELRAVSKDKLDDPKADLAIFILLQLSVRSTIDALPLVRYPSRECFVRMAYQPS